MLKEVVFTDIDGTLTDIFSGRYEGTDKLVSALKANNIPVILCSAKTRFEQTKQEKEYLIIELGKSAKEVKTMLDEIKNKFKIEFKGVADFSMKDLSKLATMSIDSAKRMAQREYGETILQIKKSHISQFI